jgi:hypothetical protein
MNSTRKIETFKGHLLLIPYIVILCVVMAIVMAMIMAGLERPYVPFLFAILPFAIVLNGMRQLFYFKLTATDLIIKNHTWPWYAKTYRITEIKSVVLQERIKKANALRLQMADLRSISYGGGSLRRKHWIALAKAFQERGIPVVSELTGVRIDEVNPTTAETR